MTATIDTAELRHRARAALGGQWVLPLCSRLDVIVPATNRTELPVTVVSARTRPEAQYITAFAPLTVLALLDHKLPRPGIELLREYARGAESGAHVARRVSEDFYEVTIEGTVIATTDSAKIAAYLVALTTETALMLLDHADQNA